MTQPFYEKTVTLLASVRDHDFATLAALCDDDFGIIGIDVDGEARPIRSRAEWEEWFSTLFTTTDSINAATDSVIVDYSALSHGTLIFGVLEFQQTLTPRRFRDVMADLLATNTVEAARPASLPPVAVTETDEIVGLLVAFPALPPA